MGGEGLVLYVRLILRWRLWPRAVRLGRWGAGWNLGSLVTVPTPSPARVVGYQGVQTADEADGVTFFCQFIAISKQIGTLFSQSC